MLKNIWPINKLYNLSDRVYQLKSQYLELCEANEKLQKENESLNKKLQVLEEKNNKLEEKNNEFSLEFASYKKEASDYDWFSKFGYDRMISDLQMSCVENILPGNRERLAALKDTLPAELKVTAESEDGEVMAVEHTKYPVFGVQFHPESVMTPDGRVMIENFMEVVRND